ncbi:AAA family ATPase [Actinoplanes xinjiangensis]|uniref:AAA ATPase-like protein n=2 Tax=Actinoplanes xinjiangensis TaxID=512350 RepID=A0A316FF55_9ACTN|nr:ATP-binding protein [Actinoplanes xinjiangensis]PWK46296.1 AAA ATPase-like protein [Actinoplanes xinjiangensis]
MTTRLSRARETAFVGRAPELEKFRAAVEGEPDAPVVLFVHGMGGVGKTTLLHRFAAEAERAHRCVVRIDGRSIEPSPAAFRAAAAPACRPNAVLLVDGFEHCQGLEGWLRDQFLPSLPEETVVVVAGRRPPGADWLGDPGWDGALATVPLSLLDEETAVEMLRRRGVDEATSMRIVAFAGGLPLALSLSSSVAAGPEPATAPWTPGPDVLAGLVTRLIGELPSARHRTALETAAHVFATTERLLGAVLGEEHAAAMFAWLRELSFAEWSSHGLTLHELVADALDRDLRWRNPQGYEQMHRAVVTHLLDRARTASPADATAATRALFHLKRHGPMRRYFETIRHEGEVYESPLRPQDHPVVLDLMARAEGATSARVAGHWLRHRPDDFRVYRDARTDAAVGFMLCLRLTGQRECAPDPVAEMCWQWITRVGPLRAGQRIMILRFAVAVDERGTAASINGGVPNVDLTAQLRVVRSWIREAQVAASFVVTPDPRIWSPLMEVDGHRRITEVAQPPGRPVTVFGHDWRAEPVEAWAQRALAAQPMDPADADVTAAAPAIGRDAFDRAVREALRHLHDPVALGASPLLTSGRMRAGEGTASAVALRNAVFTAVREIFDEPRHAQQYRALAVTYLE